MVLINCHHLLVAYPALKAVKPLNQPGVKIGCIARLQSINTCVPLGATAPPFSASPQPSLVSGRCASARQQTSPTLIICPATPAQALALSQIRYPQAVRTGSPRR